MAFAAMSCAHTAKLSSACNVVTPSDATASFGRPMHRVQIPFPSGLQRPSAAEPVDACDYTGGGDTLSVGLRSGSAAICEFRVRSGHHQTCPQIGEGPPVVRDGERNERVPGVPGVVVIGQFDIMFESHGVVVTVVEYAKDSHSDLAGMLALAPRAAANLDRLMR